MILAGDIGGTNARLAYFQPQNGNLRLISERVFPSREYSELGEIVSKFLADSATRPEVACFGIAGPVRNGRVETSNLPWIIEQSRLAKQIQLPATLLINDLEANAWGIGALGPEGSGSSESSRASRLAIRRSSRRAPAWEKQGCSGTAASIRFSPARAGTRISHRKAICRSNCCGFWRGRYGHVSYERILSGPGLVNVYEFLREKGLRRRACRICRATRSGRRRGGDFPRRPERDESAGRASAGSLDLGLRRGSRQSGSQSDGDRRNFSRRRNLPEDSFQAHGATLHERFS